MRSPPLKAESAGRERTGGCRRWPESAEWPAVKLCGGTPIDGSVVSPANQNATSGATDAQVGPEGQA